MPCCHTSNIPPCSTISHIFQIYTSANPLHSKAAVALKKKWILSQRRAAIQAQAALDDTELLFEDFSTRNSPSRQEADAIRPETSQNTTSQVETVSRPESQRSKASSNPFEDVDTNQQLESISIRRSIEKPDQPIVPQVSPLKPRKRLRKRSPSSPNKRVGVDKHPHNNHVSKRLNAAEEDLGDSNGATALDDSLDELQQSASQLSQDLSKSISAVSQRLASNSPSKLKAQRRI